MIGAESSRFSFWYASILALILAVFGIAAFRSQAVYSGAATSKTAFAGGTFEASGVVHVPGTDGVLFVDDDRTEEVFFMRLGADRKQAGKISAVKFAANIIDLEGITTDGTHYYIVGSQSKPTGGDLTGLARFKFDATAQRIVDTQSIAGLKSFLAGNVEELRGMENRSYEDGGINVEGLAWDAKRTRLLVGLRSPVVGGQALIVPLKLRDAKGAFSFENIEVEGRKAIKLPLGGAGIRSIEFDEARNAFRLITGAGPNSEKMDFKLWEWSGNGEPPALRETDTFDRRLKPEGITRVSSAGQNFTFIVFDTNGYVAKD